MWFKVDDGFHASSMLQSINKRQRLAAAGLWTVAGAWSVSQETGGFIPSYALGQFGATLAQAKALADSGLWDVVEGGWKFRHWRKSQDGDYRKNIKATVRREVMNRDQRACVLCGATENLSLDHIQRYRDDGPDTPENLRVLCMPCNLERG